MPLNEEWDYRIRRWERAIWASTYRPLGKVALSGFTTKEFLTSTDAQKRSVCPMPPGTAWGSKWEYGWFMGEIELPPEAANRRIVLNLLTGGESLVWVNGVAAGAVGGKIYREITLATRGSGGAQFHILAESYAGHMPYMHEGGPVPYGTESVPEPGPAQVVVGESTYGIWREEVYQLAVDFSTLYELRGLLDPLSLRVSEIDQALMDATMIVDVELPEPEMLQTVQAGRERLKHVLSCVNGSTAPTLLAFGHGHLDIEWKWPYAESERKIARTLSSQMALAAEYPEHRFLQSQPHLYRMLQKRYPEIYERVKAAVKKGQIVADGAMWVEADTNVTGGESLIRQILHGRRFFKQELGIDSQVLWLPDVFGYTAALPQILRGCGVRGFITSKLYFIYGGGDPFPYTTFWWEGIDATAIPAHIFKNYNQHNRPKNLVESWNARWQKHGISTMVHSFGHGDGGGGPTRDHLEFLRRASDLEGLPRVQLSSPSAFFDAMEKEGLPKERYVGELYYQAHRGCYTSQAKTKLGNRRSEFSLREAELWGSVAHALNKFDFGPHTHDESWTKLMLSQFHDVLPGSSIHRVYEETEKDLAEVIGVSQESAHAAASSLASLPGGVTVFNSLSWERTALVRMPDGEVEVTVPACGWTTVQQAKTAQRPGRVTAGEQSIENDRLRATFNAQGEIISLLDKDSGREVMAGPGNQFRLFKDVPNQCDAWDIDSMAESMPVVCDEKASFEIVANGPVVARLRFTRQLHESTITQTISLRQGSTRLDFDTTVNWHESHKLLKVCFPTNILADEAIHEIQFGHLRRPTHRSRPFDGDRWEVCQQKWSALAEENRGVAVLNDSKYGLSVTGSSINLTLLKSALAPDMTADKGIQTFTYSLYFWNGSLGSSRVVQEAYDLNCPVLVVKGTPEQAACSVFSIDAPNVIIETVKPAEDGSGDVIIRLYESMRSATKCTLTTVLPVESAHSTDMLEGQPQPLSCEHNQVRLEFRAFEIKTVRLKLRNQEPGR